MTDDPQHSAHERNIRIYDLRQQEEEIDRSLADDRVDAPWSYRVRVGRGLIQIEGVEYRILYFLATHPYRAFTAKRIAKAVTTTEEPVTAETLSRHIASLRNKLGFFADYIQSVPHIGYRYKA
ncbi:MAG: hypothetical protein CL681_10405 [Blastopirellula sp.]|nr:hypothetical protein [Blastopirellula sp.]